jgi:hypothetical protein
MLDAGYLSPLGDAEGTHLPLRRLARLCSRLGGHGQRATAPTPSTGDAPRRLAAHCDAAWYGSWAAVWRSLRGWLPTLRERSLVLGGAQLESSAPAWLLPSAGCPPPWTPCVTTRTSTCFPPASTCL